ncbi:MAG TPA: LON peptidase substrate-binding domain-containing protein, partial [Acidimicrobiales bacterium]|nr:LON peptidase substrate-binding domain-containing protein [Acidimicrobiales bacterium]
MTMLPMFPLGSVLVPGLVLPLHVFELRYRSLVRDVLAGDQEFGVVLIERGSEVGGGDTRTDVGTVARILQAEELDDGRWVVATVGTRRMRVRQWFDDDPYPRAEVDDWPDEDDAEGLAGPYADVVTLLRRSLALAAELD